MEVLHYLGGTLLLLVPNDTLQYIHFTFLCLRLLQMTTNKTAFMVIAGNYSQFPFCTTCIVTRYIRKTRLQYIRIWNFQSKVRSIYITKLHVNFY